MEWFYYKIKRIAMFKEPVQSEGHSWEGVLFFRRDLNIFCWMCKILRDKIKDIYLILYLLTCLIIRRLNEPIINTIFLLPVFTTEREKCISLYQRTLWIWVNQWVTTSTALVIFYHFFLFAILYYRWNTEYEKVEVMKILKK